jgi:hypothetical protein
MKFNDIRWTGEIPGARIIIAAVCVVILYRMLAVLFG